MDGHGEPDASGVPFGQREGDAADGDLGDGEDGDAGIEGVQQSEEYTVDRHCHPQRIAHVDPLIHEAPRPQLLRRTLDEYADQSEEVEGDLIQREVQIKMNISVDQGADDAPEVHEKTHQESEEQHLYGVPRMLREETAKDESIPLRDRRVHDGPEETGQGGQVHLDREQCGVRHVGEALDPIDQRPAEASSVGEDRTRQGKDEHPPETRNEYDPDDQVLIIKTRLKGRFFHGKHFLSICG